jgi:hypothetical protein
MMTSTSLWQWLAAVQHPVPDDICAAAVQIHRRGLNKQQQMFQRCNLAVKY